MAPEQSIKEGRLAEGLAALQARIRGNPSSVADRMFLFQLLSLCGDWDRAENQLNVAAELDSTLVLTTQVYRCGLAAERARAAAYSGLKPPLVLGQPEPWLAQLFQANQLSAQGHAEQGAELRAQALEAAPATPGRINGVAFEWLADADPRLGPCLEMVFNGKYYWVPFHRLARLEISAPEGLSDFVWARARASWTNGGEVSVLLPVRYPGTEAATDDQLRLARLTTWTDAGAGLSTGVGQRLFATESDDWPLLDTRNVEFDVPG